MTHTQSSHLTFEQRWFTLIDWCAHYLMPPILAMLGIMLIIASHTGSNLEWMEHVFRYGGVVAIGQAAFWLLYSRIEKLEERAALLEQNAQFRTHVRRFPDAR